MSTRRREDCCLIFRKSFLIRIILIIKTSILYRHLAVASCHFPRLLGKASVIVCVCEKVTPLGESKTILFNSAVTLQRFREMKGRRFACSIRQKKNGYAQPA